MVKGLSEIIETAKKLDLSECLDNIILHFSLTSVHDLESNFLTSSSADSLGDISITTLTQVLRKPILLVNSFPQNLDSPKLVFSSIVNL